MLRRSALAAFFVVAFGPFVSAESYTTRIETRPFYGAVVTLEEGVRVIRPLPTERHVIINPDGRTPLSLGFNDTRVYENRKIYNHTVNKTYGSAGTRGGGYYAPGYAGGFGVYGAHDRSGNSVGGGVSIGQHRQIYPRHHGGHHNGH